MGSRSKQRRTIELLTPYEVASWLRVSRSTVLRMVREGVLPSIRIGRGQAQQVRIERSAVEAYLRRTA